MSDEKKVKLGDKFAIIGGMSRSTVDGPYYVTSIRGSKVALSRNPKEKPTSRGWRRLFDNAVRKGFLPLTTEDLEGLIAKLKAVEP